MIAAPQEKAPARACNTEPGNDREQAQSTCSSEQSQAGTTAARISFFEQTTRRTPSGEMSILDFARQIRDGSHAEAVARVRDMVEECAVIGSSKEETKAALHPLKLALPCVTLSGVITEGGRGRAFEEGRFLHSGWLQIDLDKADLDKADLQDYAPEQVRDVLGEDPHLLFVAVSPSGEGLKGLCRIPVCETPEQHLAAFKAAEAYFLETYALRIDPQTKDPARCCYATHDPGITWNASPIELPVPAPQLPTAPPEREQWEATPTAPPTAEETSLLATPESVRHILLQIPPKRPREEWLKVCAAVADAVGEDEAIPMLEEWCAPYSPGEYQRAFKSPLQKITKGSLVAIAKSYGFDSKSYWRELYAGNQWNGRLTFAGDVLCEDEEDELPFPMHCLPGIAGEMARQIARVTTAQNEPLAAASCLAVVSASIGAGLEVGTGGERRTRGNLYALAIAASGTGKGESYKLAADPFEQLEAQAIATFEEQTRPHLTASLQVADSRAKRLVAAAAKETDRHARIGAEMECRQAMTEKEDLQRALEAAPAWKVADVTKEKLAVIMAGQPGEAVASLSSEARGIFSIVKGKYSSEGGDEDFYCSAYSGDSVTVDRVGRPRVTLRRPCLSILWMVQPDAARKAFGDSSLTESGLLPRFLTFDPKAEPQVSDAPPAPIPQACKAGWASLIGELVESYRLRGDEPRIATVTPEATALLAEYERENIRRRQSTGDLPDLAAYVARWAENAWRLAVVLHAARHGAAAHEAALDRETAGAAVELMRWFSTKQVQVLAAGRRENLKTRLLALLALLAEANGGISFRELHRSHGIDKAQVQQLAAVFPQKLTIEKRQAEMGRPSWIVKRSLEDMGKSPHSSPAATFQK
jgi:hypothetical protein